MTESKTPAFVRVVVEELTPDSVMAVRNHLAKLPMAYTPLGIGAVEFIRACDKALGKRKTR